MKAKKTMSALPVFCLLISLPVLAQQVVMPPPAIQAIDTHLQQSRTQKQHEAMEERKRDASLPPRKTTPVQPGSAKADAATRKPKAAGKPPKAAATEQSPDSRNKPATN